VVFFVVDAAVTTAKGVHEVSAGGDHVVADHEVEVAGTDLHHRPGALGSRGRAVIASPAVGA